MRGRWFYSDGDIYFHLNFSLASRFSQLGGAHANEIKHDHSPVVYVVFRSQIRRPIRKVRLGYRFTPYQRLWLYNGAPLVAFYDTLGIRRKYSYVNMKWTRYRVDVVTEYDLLPKLFIEHFQRMWHTNRTLSNSSEHLVLSHLGLVYAPLLRLVFLVIIRFSVLWISHIHRFFHFLAEANGIHFYVETDGDMPRNRLNCVSSFVVTKF